MCVPFIVFRYETRYFGELAPPKPRTPKRFLESDFESQLPSCSNVQPPLEKRPHKEFLVHANPDPLQEMMSAILAKLEKNEQTSNKKFIALENMILQNSGPSQEQEQNWDEEEEIEEDEEQEEEEVEFESFSNFIPSQAAGPGNCLQSFSLPSSCPEAPKSKVQAVSVEDK